MDSKVVEELGNTETDEGTIAVQKKRSRRVSFAEITSVHVFDRDEDYRTPPDPKPSSDNDNAELGQANEVLGFFKDLGDSEEGDDDDDEVMDGRTSFLRPMESPSPGSTIGSATSNDEDNFFGPVSSSFIRPGRLSDSATDDNHDITMDSTAFSMHFRSLARSESGGDSKTPSGVRLAFEEKTPSQNTTPTSLGSFMVLTKAKKLIPQSFGPVDNVSSGGDSNDMSLVGENPHRYDFGRLSPTLDALLTEGSKDLHAFSVSDLINTSKSPSYPNEGSKVSTFGENGSGQMDLKDCEDIELSNLCTHDRSAEEVLLAHIKVGEANGGSTTTPIDLVTYDCSSNKNDGPFADGSIDHQIRTPDQLTRGILFDQSKESIKDALETSRSKLEFSAVNRVTLSNMDNRVLQLDLLAQHESGYLCSTEGWVKENCPKDGRHNSDTGQDSDQQYQSPLTGSISLLSAKQRQVSLDTANSSRHTWIVTPSEKRPGSFSSKENIRHGESVSSIQKSISKFKFLGASPYVSTPKDGNGNSRLRSSDNLSMPPPFDAVLKENSKDPQRKYVDAPIACLEEHLLSVDQNKGEHESMINMDSNGIETPKNIKNLGQTEETADKFTKSMAAMASPSQFTWSGKKVPQHLLTSEYPTEGTLVTSGTDSSLVEIILDYRKDKKATHTPEKFVSSPVKRLEKKLSASQEYEGSLSRDLKQQDQYHKFVSFDSGQDGDSIEVVTSGSHLTAIAHKMDSLFMEKRAQSRSPFIGINNSKDSTLIKRLDGREINLPDLQNESETYGNFQTPLTSMDILNFKLGSPGRNLQTGTDPARFKNELSGGGIKASSCGSASPYVCRRSTNEPPLQKSLVEWITQSPSRNEPCDASHNDNMHSSVENSSGRKRRSEEMVLRDGDHMEEISRIQRSPKVHKGGGNDMDILLEHSNESCDETNKIGGDTALQHWADIFLKFSGDTKHLHSPLIDKLNLRAIGVLEDILVNLQKVKRFEMLCSHIRSQKTFDHFSNVRHKRASETRLLLCKMIYEQAKLQLMCVKRERLLKRVELLSSGTRESQMLKLSDFQHLSVPGARDAQVDDSHPQSLTDHFEGKHEVACDKVTTMRQEVEASEIKIKHLTNSFHTLCKMKGEPSCADTIVLVNDHLKKRTCCRFIRQDLQLWEVDDLKSRNGHHNVVLNYHGFIFQRLTINAGPASSIIISNKLNDINIVKNFPNMDACTAFAFVLKAETYRKSVGLRSLAQETQITSSLLCNLLDVVEEVQLAQVELRNLTETRFHSSSVEQLDLQLCFIDFKSGGKVTLTLDMTCLNCGVYPSEILPSQLQAPTAGSQKSPPQSLSADIRAAADSLRVGYSRIVRLCRCVSQVVQASSR